METMDPMELQDAGEAEVPLVKMDAGDLLEMLADLVLPDPLANLCLPQPCKDGCLTDKVPTRVILPMLVAPLKL